MPVSVDKDRGSEGKKDKAGGVGPKPSAGDLPHPGIKPRSAALWANALPSETPGEPEPKLTCAYKKRKFLQNKH